MATKAEFVAEIRRVIGRLRELADEAATVSDAPDPRRQEAAEYLNEAAADCQDAIDAIMAFR